VQLNDGRMIPQLGFGVWQVSARQIVPTVSTALEVGYRNIDTASAYGTEQAHSSDGLRGRIVGLTLRSAVNRAVRSVGMVGVVASLLRPLTINGKPAR
jgi:aryl-alcohol dehydrogenase-like predicted oxidoreductase